MINTKKRECIRAYEFGSGAKYIEQFYSGNVMYPAIMILQTDQTSMGYGGGDLKALPPYLARLVDPIIGRWTGDALAFAGDYTTTKQNTVTDSDGEERFTDISGRVATAVRAIELSKFVEEAKPLAQIEKEYIAFLKEERCMWEDWMNKESVKCVLSALRSAYKHNNRIRANDRQGKYVEVSAGGSSIPDKADDVPPFKRAKLE